MAKLSQGILGPVNGKVGAVVGSNWKGINTVRGYAIPADPQTTSQLAQRSLFGWIIGIAKLLLPSVLQPFWDPFSSQMSGFNSFVKTNRLGATTLNDYSDIVVAQGSLESQPLDSVTYDSSSGSINFNWTMSIQGNGLETDVAFLVVIDSANNVSFLNEEMIRGDEGNTFSIGTGRNAGDLKAWIFMVRGEGETLEVSNSVYSAVSAA